MARVYLDARNITAKPAGVARYAQCLIPELVKQAPEYEYVIVRHASNREPILLDTTSANIREVFIDVPIDNLVNYVWGHHALHRVFAQCGEPTIYHDLFHVLPRKIRTRGYENLRVVVTLHDLVWIDYPHLSQPNWLAAKSIQRFAAHAIPYALRHADYVISVSEPTARRAGRWLTHGRFTTIYHGVHADFFLPAELPPTLLSSVLDSQEGYVVAIGNDKKYKNLHTLIHAFQKVRAHLGRGHLVLVGACDGLRPLIEQYGLMSYVHLVGFLDERTLRQVVSHARLFVFPSLVEGFGLPILEAMAAGVPTVVSDVEPMRTIAGASSMFFEPHDVDGLARLIHRVVQDDHLFECLRVSGKHRARKFQWCTTAQKTLNVYERLIKQR